MAEQPILTIADIDEFARLGGIIHLKVIKQLIRFEINTNLAQRVGLTFRSDLLMLADVISGEIMHDRFRNPI